MSISSGRKRSLRVPSPLRRPFASSLYARTLRCEQLEDRRLLAQLTVTTDQDIVDLNDGVTSLREAIFAANLVPGADEIVFDFGHDGPATILLTQGELRIEDSLTITGPGAGLLTIDNSLTQGPIFNVDDLTNNVVIEVGLSGITLTGSQNSAIRSVEDLTVDGMVFRGNSGRYGGGIAVNQNGSQALNVKLTVRNSRFEDNHALIPVVGSGGAGGGISFIGRFGELTIENTSFVGNSGTSGGGVGVIGYSNLMNITDSQFVENQAHLVGGGITITDDNAKVATLTRVEVKDNIAAVFGGGIYITGKAVTIVDSEIAGNRTTASTASSMNGGGGIFKQGGDTFIVINSTIRENHSISYGGGILLQGSGLQLTDSVVEQNTAIRGGGIALQQAATVEISRSTISGNIALRGGGLYSHSLATNTNLRILDSTISGNTANESGGGMYVVAESFLLRNSTVTGNDAGGSGGGLLVGRGTRQTIIEHSTITDNTSDADENDTGRGGGLFSEIFAAINIQNSIIAGNHDNTGAAHDVSGNIASTFSLIGVGAEFLGPLANNGGPTKTHALLAGSPALNAGEPTLVGSANGVPAFDQRGEPFKRVFGSAIDIGAFEAQSLVVDTLADEIDGDYSAGNFSLREAIELANQIAGANTIEFSPALAGGTILMTLGEYAITESLEIVGLGAELLTIDAQQQSRIFNVTIATTGGFAISGMTLTGGSTSGVGTAFGGGAIRSMAANLTINHSVITGNSTTGSGARGGAIYSLGHLQLDASRISNNHTQGNNAPGGALSGANASITDSVFENNRTYGSNSGGGAVVGNPRQLGWQINHSSFLENKTFGSNSPGGAIAYVGGLSVNDSTFAGNATYGTQGHGGAIYGGSMSISFSSFTENTVHSGNGGAIHAYDLTIASSSLTNNSVNSGTGGAILAQWNLDIVDSVLSKNQSIGNNGGGGAIAQTGFSNRMTILRSKITDNESVGLNAAGGGIRTHVPTTITATEISGNRVVGQGGQGGGLFAQALTTITDSTISGNHIIGSSGAGGGVFLMGTNPVYTLLNSTLSGNQITGEQSRGAGLYSMGRINLRHSTVTGNRINSTTGQAGGLWLTQSQSTISHSIIAANFTGPAASDLRGQPQLSYSLVGTSAGTEFIEAPVESPDANGNLIGGPVHGMINPLLGPLADNGGPTKTHALLPGSPAINAGAPALLAGVGGTPLFDQRGAPFARVAEGRIDIGAYESQPAAGLFSADFDSDGDVDGRDFLIWQRGYGLVATATRGDGDATGDGVVDGNDLIVWQETYGTELSAISSQLSARQESRAESPELERSRAPWAVPRLDDAWNRVPCYDDICDLVFYLPTNSRDYAEVIDQAFDHWLPPRRFSTDFGDIVAGRHVKRCRPEQAVRSSGSFEP